MLLCVNCKSPVKTHTEACPVCAYTVPQRDGFSILSLTNDESDDVHFPSESFAMLYEKEAENFWFRARNDILLWAVKKYANTDGNFFEIGCGTAYVLSHLHQQLPDMQFYGSDLYVEALPFAQKRLQDVQLFQMDALNIPFKQEFDGIGMFDVLEHIEEDVDVLKQTYNALKPGGKLILTVPQHRFLWSITDTLTFHKRRYTRQELVQKANEANMDVLYIGSFVSLLLPVMMLVRLLSSAASKTTQVQDVQKVERAYNLSAFVNNVLYFIMQVENALIRLGVNFPMGGSLLMVAQARETTDQ